MPKNAGSKQYIMLIGSEASLLPKNVHEYHSLYPIDSNNERISRVFGLQSSVYKSQRTIDGKYYCLRRIENYRMTNKNAISVIDPWTKLNNSGIVSVREGFTTKAFGDQCNSDL